MKRVLLLFLSVVMVLAILPTSVLAFDQYAVYVGQAGCQLVDFQFSKSMNPWLMWDVTFTSYCDGRVLETTKAHARLVGQTVIPTFTFEGDRVTFNGEDITSAVSPVVLREENDLVVYGNGTRAEYQISVTEVNNGIPTVLIDTDGAAIPDKINYVDTKITLLGAEVYGGSDLYAAIGGIKLRGNSTSMYDKKPYRIKFEKKQNIFGLGKAKSWVLLANYLDPSAIRNDIAYSFGARLSAMTAKTTGFQVYVPRMRPVEVYLNGEYLGLYDMGDHVQADSTRIAIDESGEEFDDNGTQLYPEGNVGYYLEVEDSSRVLAEYESEGAAYFVIENTGGDSKNELYVQVKVPEVPSKEQLTYIENYLQNVNDLIRAQDPRVWEYIDMDGFIDWYLINEVFKNTDSNFLSSVKMFKDKDGKLFMGPVWDFDLGSGAVAYSKINNPTGWRTRDTERADWYENLFEMPEFSEAVNVRWKQLHEEGILEGIFTDIDSLSAFVADAAHQNYAKWHENYVNGVNETSWLTVPDIQTSNDDWEVQPQYLRNYMTARIAWMDEQFGYVSSSSTSTLSGEVVILGAPEYRETLTASTLAVKPYGASVSYQWYANGTAISGATSSTYKPTVAQIGASITVKVTGKSSYKGSLTSAPVTVQYSEKTTATSQVPPFVSKTHNTIVVSEREGYDISIDGGVTWQTSGTFTDLEPNTLYRVTYRHKNGIDNYQPGKWGKALYVITDPDEAAPPVEEPSGMIGDLDQDGVVNTSDARILVKYLTGSFSMSEDMLAVADYTADGLLNTSDVRAIIQSTVVA